MNDIIIQISGGLVQLVTLDGQEVSATIHDYDVEGLRGHDVEYDAEKMPYILRHC